MVEMVGYEDLANAIALNSTHADIIVKGGREVEYGHKLNLTTGRSGLILDLVIEPAIQRTVTASCPCSTATSASMARRPTDGRRRRFCQPS